MGSQVEIRCLCGQFTELVHLKSTIPANTTICACNICRQTSGSLYWSGLRISDPPAESVKQKLAGYNALGKGTRYFCPTCGSHVIYHMLDDDGWGICSGAVDRVVDEKAGKGLLEKVTQIEYAADSVDGGLASCFKGDDGRDVTMYAEEESGKKWDGPSKDASVEMGEKLYAACHCKGTEFYLAKPESDLGLSAGQPISTWAFVSQEKVLHLDGSQRNQDLFGTLKRYESSPGTVRDFCKTCGACVFYYCDSRPAVTDVAVGILRAPEGSLGKNWLSWWTGHVNESDNALDQGLAKQFMDGMKVLSES